DAPRSSSPYAVERPTIPAPMTAASEPCLALVERRVAWAAVIDAPLVERLRNICGRDHVLTDEHELRTYESDGLRHYRTPPAVAVLPGSAGEVREIVRACHRAEVPWVARGAGTGLSGGAIPVEDGLLIVLTRLNKILDID